MLTPRVEQAFRDGVGLTGGVCEYGVRKVARRWGDARKALTFFRQAGAAVTERTLEQVTIERIEAFVD